MVDQYRKQIEDALGLENTHTFEDIAAAVAANEMQFWHTADSAMVTQLIRTPQHLTCHFFLAGGTLPDMERMAAHVEQWAKEQGCTRCTFHGRAGWERTFLARTGWTKVPAIFMEKSLV